jgi:hypothetical protein
MARAFNAISFLRIFNDATQMGAGCQKSAEPALGQANDEYGTVIQQHHSPRSELKIVHFSG